jgi:hypothetical protein
VAVYTFEKIAKEGKLAGITPGTEDARDWFRDRASSVNTINVEREMRNKARLYQNVVQSDIGRMYMYFYDPKTKDDLPYYDRFPLIFVAEKYKDGFLGLNLHYLPPIFRARLMDALYKIERNDSVRDSKKLKMTYNLMKSAAQFRYFKPCVKRYLYSQIKSRFLYIPYEDWDIALFLPTERFKKAKKQKVWEDSKRIIRK